MNKPFTKEEIQDLPKGLTPSKQPNRSFFKQMRRGLLLITQAGLIKLYHPNCRKLTKGRIEYKTLKFGRLTNFKKGK